MKSKRNNPIEHIDSPQVIATGDVNLVNGYMTVKHPFQQDFPEAPVDNNLYARNNASWKKFTNLTDAPSDNNLYARKNGAWSISTQVVALTQAQYNSITPDPNTLYLING